MTSPRPLQSIRIAIGLVLALATAACTPGSGQTSAPTTATPGPAGSPVAGACQAAPEPADPEAWIGASSAPAVIPLIVSSQQVCGTNRVLIGLLDPENRSIGAPDRPLEVSFFNLGRDPETPTVSETGEFIWAIEGSRGLYVVEAGFAESGVWGAEVRTTDPAGQPVTVRVAFDVRRTGITKRIGDEAPASDTPTAADVGGDLSNLSTDDPPDARFYEASVADALAAGEPFVLVFATPKFCASAVCGPTLDKVKPLLDDFPDVTFINVEPYQLELQDGQLQPVLDADGQLQPVASVTEWGLITEPWIFVVDDAGTIRGSFEGAIGENELRTALGALG